MNQVARKEELLRRLTEVRERTLFLLEHVPDEFLQRRVHSFYSPIGWHFGHVGRTEDYWVSCAALKRPPCDERLDFLYTDRPDNPKDNRVHVPDRAETVAYLRQTRDRVVAALEETNLDTDDPYLGDGYAWEFAIQHECQHQETICEMLCLIQKQLPPREVEPIRWRTDLRPTFVPLAGGAFRMGTDEATAYDNEKAPHEVEVAPFELRTTPVTCYEWERFIDGGGYDCHSLWTDEGRAWCVAENVQAPEYWIRQGDAWVVLGPFGARPLHPDEPVCGVSHHEAMAFIEWNAGRLPSEAEWEFAARAGRYPWGDETPTDAHARHRMHEWGPAQVGTHSLGATPEGVQDMGGNVWEWTSSPFLPYPGFDAFPYDGYSKDHMKGEHMVCRGGSWATASPILRRTFRNWYVPTYRQGFLGVRLAR
ncbi:MAG: SUMF1/EgtB/PvdO family nonheme iron enzyme [Fimbriimonas sp.]